MRVIENIHFCNQAPQKCWFSESKASKSSMYSSLLYCNMDRQCVIEYKVKPFLEENLLEVFIPK